MGAAPPAADGRRRQGNEEIRRREAQLGHEAQRGQRQVTARSETERRGRVLHPRDGGQQEEISKWHIDSTVRQKRPRKRRRRREAKLEEVSAWWNSRGREQRDERPTERDTNGEDPAAHTEPIRGLEAGQRPRPTTTRRIRLATSQARPFMIERLESDRQAIFLELAEIKKPVTELANTSVVRESNPEVTPFKFLGLMLFWKRSLPQRRLHSIAKYAVGS